MEINGMQLSAAIGQHIFSSSIEIRPMKGQNREELFHFLCSTCIVPKAVFINSIGSTTGQNNYQFLIQVV
jgi:hypothetical protein